MRKHLLFAGILTAVFLLNLGSGLCQVKEEQAEKTLEIRKLPPKESSYKLSNRAALFFGYDSNANLSSIRKGDLFEEFLYSVDFTKPFLGDMKATFDYDLDVLNYNEKTDVSNILNHIRLGLHKDFLICSSGFGYDVGMLYYPNNEDGNFIFHRGFFYLKKDISNKTYHKLEFQYGLKDYRDERALAHTINTYKDDDRFDKRSSAEYSVASLIFPELLIRWRAKFSLNDSNAQFLDFYDYKSYKTSLSLYYKLLERVSLQSTFTYIRKKYDERTVVQGAYRQRDNLYSATVGAVYKLDEINSLSLHYTYRENFSNDFFGDYSESIISFGWRCSF